MPTRTSVPQNYITSDGTLLEAFDNYTDWTAQNCVITQETTLTRSGNAIKLVGNNPTQVMRATKTVNLDLSDAESISVWIWIDNADDIYNGGAHIYFSSSAWSKWLVYDTHTTAKNLTSGWNEIKVTKSQFTVSGGDSFANTITTVRFAFNTNAATTPTIIIDSLYKNIKGIANIVLTFDDAWTSVYTNAFPYMASKGLKGTTWIIKDNVGVGNYCSLAQLQEMYAGGWDISNHTTNHHNMSTTTSVDDAISYIQPVIDYLKANGMNRGHQFFCPPYGDYNSYTLTALATLGVYASRTTIYDNQHNPPTNIYELKTRPIDNNSTVASLQTWVEQAILTGSTVFFMIHKVDDNAGDSLSWQYTNSFKPFIDWLVDNNNKRLRVLTMTEWYAGLSNPRLMVSR